jgi:cytochrome P450 family 6
VSEALARFSLDVIGKCAFGVQFNCLTESNSFYRRISKTLNEGGLKGSFRILLHHFLNPNLLKLLGVKITTDEVENFFINMLRSAEKLRRHQQDHRDDFLQLLLHYKEENDKASKPNRKLSAHILPVERPPNL